MPTVFETMITDAKNSLQAVPPQDKETLITMLDNLMVEHQATLEAAAGTAVEGLVDAGALAVHIPFSGMLGMMAKNAAEQAVADIMSKAKTEIAAYESSLEQTMTASAQAQAQAALAAA